MCFRIASHRLSQRLLQRRRVLQRRLRIIQLQWRKLHWSGCSSEGNLSNNPRALLLSIEKKRTLCRFYFLKETVVRRNPKFISTSKTIIVNEGDTIKLPCQVSSSSIKFWVFGPCHEHQHQHHLNRNFVCQIYFWSQSCRKAICQWLNLPNSTINFGYPFPAILEDLPALSY